MKKTIICFLSVLCICFLYMPITNNSQSFAKENNKTDINISAKSALLMDFDSGTIIYEKNSHERLPIASMTKLATLSIIFNYIDKGIVKENDMVNVSENSAKVGGSSAFLDAGSSYKVTDLLKTIIVASANDSSVAMAEFVAGSEESFVAKMNKLAVDMNLSDTNFVNCTGLPIENHFSSANDIAKIYKTICDHPIYKKYAKIWMEDFLHPSGRKTGLVNTNRLVKTFDGIEGGKTGYTDSAKFCLTASAKRSDLRLIAVVIGVSDSKTRFAETTKLFNHGFANYQNNVIVKQDVPLTINNFKNAKMPVEIYPEKNISKFLNKTEETLFTNDYQINNLSAPIKSGDVIGKLFVFDKNNMVVDEINLIVKQDVDEIGIKERLKNIINRW